MRLTMFWGEFGPQFPSNPEAFIRLARVSSPEVFRRVPCYKSMVVVIHPPNPCLTVQLELPGGDESPRVRLTNAPICLMQIAAGSRSATAWLKMTLLVFSSSVS